MKKLNITGIIKSAVSKQEAEMLAASASRYKALEKHQMPAPSLSGWMNIVNQADVPAIGAIVVGEISVSSVLMFDQIMESHDGKKTVKPGMESALEELKWLQDINQSLGQKEMLRWDVCAPFGVKLAMSKPNELTGRPKDENGYAFYLSPDDPRAFDILCEHPEPTIKIIKRPWVNALMLDGYPVEFRVYIDNNEILGVCNYYLQRDLPVNEHILQLAEQAVDYARRIIKQCHEAQIFPANPRAELCDTHQVTATLDFMVSENNELLFIEGGPGFGYGAHPCCFIDGNKLSRIEGIKLGVKTPSIALKRNPPIEHGGEPELRL